MDIAFRDSRLKKICNSLRSAQKKWGTRGGVLVMRRLDDLHAADVLEDICGLPQTNCHELKGDRKGQLAVDLEHPRRLIFEPANAPPPRKEDGGLDWARVTSIRVIEVVDYHGD